MPAVIEQSNSLVQVGYMLITGKHFGPFWFIPMISLVYLLAPLLLYLDRCAWFYRYGFPLLLIAGFFSYRFGYNSSVFESLWYFLPVYVFGMGASRYQNYITERGYAFLIPLAVLYGMITYLEITDVLAIGKTYAYGESMKENAYLFNFGKLKASALCIILLVLLHKLQPIKAPWWGTLASYSFGIFFVHLYVIRSLEVLLSKLNIAITFNSGLYLTYIGVTVLVCIAIVKFVKFVTKKNSRYLIGC
jgi:surface polysaccharide O-acyltransferase-like enzyme